jgi:hypothetical protein
MGNLEEITPEWIKAQYTGKIKRIFQPGTNY